MKVVDPTVWNEGGVVTCGKVDLRVNVAVAGLLLSWLLRSGLNLGTYGIFLCADGFLSS